MQFNWTGARYIPILLVLMWCHAIVPTGHYSETPLVRNMSLWTESLFFQQPIIPKTNNHCSEGPLFQNYTLWYHHLYYVCNLIDVTDIFILTQNMFR